MHGLLTLKVLSQRMSPDAFQFGNALVHKNGPSILNRQPISTHSSQPQQFDSVSCGNLLKRSPVGFIQRHQNPRLVLPKQYASGKVCGTQADTGSPARPVEI